MTRNEKKFTKFLDDLAIKSGHDKLIESVKQGYRACFEADGGTYRFAEPPERLNWPDTVPGNEFSDNPKAFLILKAIHDALYQSAYKHDYQRVVGYGNVGTDADFYPEFIPPLPTWDTLKAIAEDYASRYDDSDRYANGTVQMGTKFFALQSAMESYGFTRDNDGTRTTFCRWYTTPNPPETDDEYVNDFLGHLETGLSPECWSAAKTAGGTLSSWDLAEAMGWKKDSCGPVTPANYDDDSDSHATGEREFERSWSAVHY